METELRLGLPGGGGGGGGSEGSGEVVMRKRGFSETESSTTDEHIDTANNNIVDLKLNLNSSKDEAAAAVGTKTTDHRANINIDNASKTSLMQKEKNLLPADPAKPPAK